MIDSDVDVVGCLGRNAFTNLVSLKSEMKFKKLVLHL